MKKNLFFTKKIKFNYLTFFLLLIFLLLIYLILFLININKPYIIINNVVPNYFIIPLDKEGKKN